jgi:hypothetical protein
MTTITLPFVLGETVVSWDSAVGIPTGYRLHGPGIELGWWREFPHRSRPDLWRIKPPKQWVPGLSRE